MTKTQRISLAVLKKAPSNKISGRKSREGKLAEEYIIII